MPLNEKRSCPWMSPEPKINASETHVHRCVKGARKSDVYSHTLYSETYMHSVDAHTLAFYILKRMCTFSMLTHIFDAHTHIFDSHTLYSETHTHISDVNSNRCATPLAICPGGAHKLLHHILIRHIHDVPPRTSTQIRDHTDFFYCYLLFLVFCVGGG